MEDRRRELSSRFFLGRAATATAATAARGAGAIPSSAASPSSSLPQQQLICSCPRCLFEAEGDHRSCGREMFKVRTTWSCCIPVCRWLPANTQRNVVEALGGASTTRWKPIAFFFRPFTKAPPPPRVRPLRPVPPPGLIPLRPPFGWTSFSWRIARSNTAVPRFLQTRRSKRGGMRPPSGCIERPSRPPLLRIPGRLLETMAALLSPEERTKATIRPRWPEQ